MWRITASYHLYLVAPGVVGYVPYVESVAAPSHYPEVHAIDPDDRAFVDLALVRVTLRSTLETSTCLCSMADMGGRNRPQSS